MLFRSNTRAERDGDEYVINGQKIFTSLATDADYVWLAVRTDQNVKKHKGISIIIVPTDTPGFKAEPISNMGGFNTNATFYEDVRVPVANLVGEENQGWKLITNQLNHERVTLFASGVMGRALTEVTHYAQETKLPDGRRVIDQPWVQYNLAKLQAKVEVVRLMNWQVAWHAEQGHNLDPAAASAVSAAPSSPVSSAPAGSGSTSTMPGHGLTIRAMSGKSLRSGCPSNSGYMRMRRRSG